LSSKRRDIFLWGLALYAAVLAASWWVQHASPAEEPSGLHERSIPVQFQDTEVSVAYRELGVEHREGIPVVLLPDVYFEVNDLLPFATELSRSHRVIIPEISGLTGRTLQQAPTTTAKAELLGQWVREMELDEMHLAGFSYGGLIAMEYGVGNGEYVKSFTFLGSLGVQELRFLGNHTVNRTLYSLLKPGLFIYRYAIPHFGYAQDQRLDMDYVESMRHIDQRDVREWLKHIEKPVLLMHAENDQYVPLSTSQESYRLIPQSELRIMGGKHDAMWTQAAVWAEELRLFLERVEDGSAPARADADPERVEKSKQPFDAESMEPLSGSALLIIIVLIMIFTIFSEDLAVIAAGLLTAGGILPFGYAVMSCFLGILLVDVNIYWLGRRVGRPALRRVPFKWLIKENDLERAQNLYDMYGMELLFVARFIPGARFPTYFTAGLFKADFKKFFLYFFLSITLWTPLLVGLSVLIGQPMLQYISVYQDYAIWILLLTIAIIYLVIKVVVPLTTVRGRRRMLVKWSRFMERFSRMDL
jgi:membrane protein DedA with SNARE-associated domain/pimeloyl-ACP methyl ester carboxylesterase